MDDTFYMQEALKEAKNAYDLNEVPVGAVLVYKHEIISRSYNLVETNKSIQAHAEMLCLEKAAIHFNNWRLIDTVLYCTLEPCCMCAGAIILSRVSKVVWSAKDLRVGANGTFINVFEKPHPIHQVQIQGGLLEEESARLMRSFFQKQRIQKYENRF